MGSFFCKFRRCSYLDLSLVQTAHIPRQEESLSIVFSKIPELELNPETELSWVRFQMDPPVEMDVQGAVVPPLDAVKKWIELRQIDPLRQLLGIEAYPMDFTLARKSRVTRFFEAAFATLVRDKTLQDIPKKAFPRLFFYEAKPNEKRVSANDLWYIDFMQTKSFDEMKDIQARTSRYCVCNITSEAGPRTYLLDAYDIELPIVHAPGKTRALVLGHYIDQLLEEGRVSMRPLKANTWYLMHANQIHRGPRFGVDSCEKADRAFFHITGIKSSPKMTG